MELISIYQRLRAFEAQIDGEPLPPIETQTEPGAIVGGLAEAERRAPAGRRRIPEAPRRSLPYVLPPARKIATPSPACTTPSPPSTLPATADARPRRGDNNNLRKWEKSMKHAYMPRTTTYNLNPGEELNDLRMSDEVRPLYEHVKKFIRETVDPMSVEFYRLGESKKDRWSFTDGQLEVLGKAKDKAKEDGLWNFFLPDDETGQGLKNLDYAYIAVELGKNPLASETMNCSAPDTGNMEVLERVGTPAQKEKWLKPLLAGEIRSAYAMTEPNVASSDAKNISTRAKLVGDEWVINGEKYYISGAGDPRCKIMIVMVKTSPDAAPQQAAVADPGADRHARRRDHRADARVRPRPRAARPHAPALQQCAGAEGEHAARRRPRLRDLAGAARAGPHPSLHAHHRQGRKGARPDGDARPDPRSLRQADRPSRRQHADHRRRRACEIEAMRLMVLKAAKAMDVLGNKEARVWVSMVKAMVPERVCKIIDQAIQMHGATGISQWTPARRDVPGRAPSALRRRPGRGAPHGGRPA